MKSSNWRWSPGSMVYGMEEEWYWPASGPYPPLPDSLTRDSRARYLRWARGPGHFFHKTGPRSYAWRLRGETSFFYILSQEE